MARPIREAPVLKGEDAFNCGDEQLNEFFDMMEVGE